MDDLNLKNQMINSMLLQTMHEKNQKQNENENENQNQKQEDGQLKKIQLPDKETLEKFKELVQMYIQSDDVKRRLQEATREQTSKCKKLSQSILMFMAKYDIEDLKASDGVRLRYKKTVVKEPLSAKTIKERIEEKYEELKGKSKEEIEQEIFQRKEIEKVSLRRLKRNTLEI